MTLAFYKKIALGLWGIVAVVAGYTAGVLFGLSGRELLFPLVLGIGMWGLIAARLLMGVAQHGEIQVADENVKLIGGVRETAGSLEELINRDQNLSPDEARRWLDGFLERHQK